MHSAIDVVLRCRSKARFDLRNHIAAANNSNLIPDLNAQSFNFTEIVQGCVFYCHATNTLGRNACNGSDIARPASLPVNIEENRCSFFWRELPCKRPARMMCRHTEQISLFEIIDFENESIDFKAIGLSASAPGFGLFAQ